MGSMEIIFGSGIMQRQVDPIVKEEIETWWEKKGIRLPSVDVRIDGEELIVITKEKKPIKRTCCVTDTRQT